MNRDEIEFYLDGKKPKDLPLVRLAEYMREFAALLGENENIFFSDVREGSTRIVAYAKQGRNLSPAVNRALALSRGEGPEDARRAHRRIGAMARKDGRRAARITRNKTTLLHIAVPQEIRNSLELRIRDRGHLTGQLWGVLTKDKKTLGVRIRPLDGSAQIQCTASVGIADKLGIHISKPIRVHGPGWWARSPDGEWRCESLEIESVEPVRSVTLIDAFRDLREVDLGWTDDPILEEFWRESSEA